MIVKVCGITTREDAVAAVEAGASALGFNFWPGSRRHVTAEMAARLGEGLDVLKVGVFVDEARERVDEIARIAGLDVAQLHGSEGPEQFPALRVWKAFRVREGWDPGALEGYDAEAFLLDGPAPGTGQAFDWAAALGLKQRIILAGGLGPENVAEAIRLVRPWGVDACSKVELAPGFKDHMKVRRFIEAAMKAI